MNLTTAAPAETDSKLIFNPDGSVLRARFGTIATVLIARREYVGSTALIRSMGDDQLSCVELTAEAEMILMALAAKAETTVEAMRAELAPAVDRLYRKNRR